MHEAAVAEDNLAALGCLEEPCAALHKALPQVSFSTHETAIAATAAWFSGDIFRLSPWLLAGHPICSAHMRIRSNFLLLIIIWS